jgi:hypothetical protein
MHNRQPKGARYLVWNRALVAEVVADAVNNDYHGCLRAGVIATNRAVEKAGHRRGDGSVGRLYGRWPPRWTTRLHGAPGAATAIA